MGPLWLPVAILGLINNHASAFYPFLTISEAFIIRQMIEHVWKRVPPLLEEFWQCFLITCNSMIVILLTLQRFTTNENSELVYGWAGLETWEYSQPLFKTYFARILFVLALIALTGHGVSLIIKKLKTDSIDSVLSGPEGNAGVNNIARNKEVFNAKLHGLVVVVGIVLAAPAILTYFIVGNQNAFTDLELSLIDINTYVMVSVFVPIFMYAKNESLRQHWTNYLKDLFS